MAENSEGLRLNRKSWSKKWFPFVCEKVNYDDLAAEAQLISSREDIKLRTDLTANLLLLWEMIRTVFHPLKQCRTKAATI